MNALLLLGVVFVYGNLDAEQNKIAENDLMLARCKNM